MTPTQNLGLVLCCLPLGMGITLLLNGNTPEDQRWSFRFCVLGIVLIVAYILIS